MVTNCDLITIFHYAEKQYTKHEVKDVFQTAKSSAYVKNEGVFHANNVIICIPEAHYGGPELNPGQDFIILGNVADEIDNTTEEIQAKTMKEIKKNNIIHTVETFTHLKAGSGTLNHFRVVCK